MQALARVSIKRPVFATVLILGITVLGLVGYFQLGVDRFPKVDFPMVSVATRLPGAAPAEVETDVTDKLEEALNSIGGIEELRSVSSEGVSLVYIQFQLGKDIDVAAQEVRDRVNTALAQLPRDIEQPAVTKLDPGATPVLYLAVNADRPMRETSEIADRVVRRQLENVPGVGQVNVLGGRKRQINVFVDPVKVRAFGLTAPDVQRAILGGSLNAPAGNLSAAGGQLTLRIHGRAGSPAELASLVLRTIEGRPVRVADVARVEDGEEEPTTLAAKDGLPGVVLSIRKQSDANTVAVVDAIRERVSEIQPLLPAGVRLEVVRDNSRTIRTSVHAVREHLLLGALFAALVVLLFLANLRSTVIAALAIPVSIIGTFALMWSQGFNLDTITLLALALAVGIVIDDAIVVLENIHRFIHDKGMPPFQAAAAATREIGLAVLATTLSLLAVFVPVAFMGGIVGRFLKSFGLTMAFAIAVSLVVSFTLTPMLSARWLQPLRPHGSGPGGRHARPPLLARIVDRCYLPVERLYVAVLAWVMRHRWVVVVASLLVLASTVPLMGAVKKGFLPESDEAHFEINVRAPEGTSLEGTALIAERLAREVRGMPGVLFTLVTVADNNERAANKAAVYVKLVDPDQRTASQAQIMDRVRKEVVAHQSHDLRLNVSDVPLFSGGQADAVIAYSLGGPDLEVLSDASARVTAALARAPGAVDVSTTLVMGKPELGVYIDRERAADLGVAVADVAATLRLLVAGGKAGTYDEHGQSYDVLVRAEKAFRADAQGLAAVTVPSTLQGAVPLSEVVRLERGDGPGQINRLNRRREVTITANVAPGASEASVLAALQKSVADLKLPAAYHAGAVGRSKEMGKAQGAFLLAFGLSFLFMYLILAAQFESWLHPITILLALPLTLPFALFSLVLTGQSLNIFSALGLLVLFGVVKKNAILQIDHTNGLRAAGMDRLPAILTANRERLRPILMTTFAFVAGMIPLAMSRGIGAGFNRATSGVVLGGQLLSLLLTLLATPVAYSLFDDAGAWFARKLGRKRAAGEVVVDEEVVVPALVPAQPRASA
jgi:HAE1 family hydrophobic/amphiphilic exporter-1